MNQIIKTHKRTFLAASAAFIFLVSLVWFYFQKNRTKSDFPSDGTVTLAFEDKKQGPDFDYNDFVVEIKINEVFANNQLQQVIMHLKPKAKMAGYKSSFFLKLKTSQGTAFNGDYNATLRTRLQNSEPVKIHSLSSTYEPIVIFPDTGLALSQGQEVDLEFQLLNPELNPRGEQLADLYSRYTFGLDVTDKYGNRYQVEYINQGLNQEDATQRPLSILIPIKNWRIPKERTSSYRVYSDLTQHINFLRGLVSEDKLHWYEEVTDESLIEKENFLFKLRKATPVEGAPGEAAVGTVNAPSTSD